MLTIVSLHTIVMHFFEYYLKSEWIYLSAHLLAGLSHLIFVISWMTPTSTCVKCPAARGSSIIRWEECFWMMEYRLPVSSKTSINSWIEVELFTGVVVWGGGGGYAFACGKFNYISGRSYVWLGNSNSQLRDHGIYMFHETKIQTVSSCPVEFQ